MEEDEEAELRELIAECDETIAEDRDSPDPVAERRVIDALKTKAGALRKLGAHEERLPMWDEIIIRRERAGEFVRADRARVLKAHNLRRLDRTEEEIDVLLPIWQRFSTAAETDDGRDDIDIAVVTAATGSLISTMLAAGRDSELLALSDDLIAHTSASDDPAFSRLVSWALYRRFSERSENDAAGAVADSDELLRRVRAEPDPDSATELGGWLLDGARRLGRTGTPSRQGMFTETGFILACNATEGISRLPGPPGWIGRLLAPVSLQARATRLAAGIESRRIRHTQVVHICDGLIEQFGGEMNATAQELVAKAKLVQSVSLVYSGHLLRGAELVDELVDSGTEAAGVAFEDAADRNAKSPVGVVGSATALMQRAKTLGNGEPRIARIAYEESIKPGMPHSPTSWPARIVFWLLRPRTGD